METYKARLIQSHDPATVGGIRLKPYSIASEGRAKIAMRPVHGHAAEALARSSIPVMAHCRLGYVIYHAGTDGYWLLVRVWLDGGIVAGLLARVDGERCTEVADPLIECVWEEIPAHHERDAWVRHMMTDPENPQGYLRDRLPDGYH